MSLLSNNIARGYAHACIMTLTVIVGLGTFGCDNDVNTATPSPNNTCGVEVDVYTPGLKRLTDAGLFIVTIVDANPTPPERGDNWWTVQVTEPDGTPRNDLEVKAEPFMSIHDHGTVPKYPAGTSIDTTGHYEMERIYFLMPGPWEIKFTLVDPNGASDTTQFLLCIEG
jgi:hypothetical protein